MKSARYSVKNRIIRVVIISCKISFLVLFIDLSDRISRIHFKELIINPLNANGEYTHCVKPLLFASAVAYRQI